MPTMNISLNEELKKHVEKRVAEGGYTSSSEYIRRLIRNDEYESKSIIDPDHYHRLTDEQRKKAKAKLDALLDEGLEGEATEMTEQDWIDIRTRGLARIAERKKRESDETD
jgi:antitoxin ParD1/3/4